MSKLLTFCEWKEKIIKEDCKKNNGVFFFRDRYWYYHKYGVYCIKHKRQVEAQDLRREMLT